MPMYLFDYSSFKTSELRATTQIYFVNFEYSYCALLFNLLFRKFYNLAAKNLLKDGQIKIQ